MYVNMKNHLWILRNLLIDKGENMTSIDRINDVCRIIKDFVGADKVDAKGYDKTEVYNIYRGDEVLVIHVLSTPTDGGWINVTRSKIGENEIKEEKKMDNKNIKTDNNLEGLFGGIKNGERRCSGRKVLSKNFEEKIKWKRKNTIS